MKISFKQTFKDRNEISTLLGGDTQKGIAKSNKINAILLFMNSEELYSDYFYPKGTHEYCMYTGIGRIGHQDSIQNNMYNLNIEILSHKRNKKDLLVFDKINEKITFIGQYKLLETHQNIQPDETGNLRRVFVFHLQQISDTYTY